MQVLFLEIGRIRDVQIDYGVINPNAKLLLLKVWFNESDELRAQTTP